MTINYQEVSELLRRARALIANFDAWTVNTTARDRWGIRRDPLDQKAVSFDMWGAFERAARDFRHDEVKDKAWDLLRQSCTNLCGYDASIIHADAVILVNDRIRHHGTCLAMFDMALLMLDSEMRSSSVSAAPLSEVEA